MEGCPGYRGVQLEGFYCIKKHPLAGDHGVENMQLAVM
jgi:hypothetical protein